MSPGEDGKSAKAITKAVERTFEVAANFNLTNIRHPTNPNLKAEEMLPVFPDFENWPNRYRLAVYDSDPIRHSSFKDKVSVCDGESKFELN